MKQLDRKNLIAMLASTERKLALTKMRIAFLKAEIKALNKIIEKRLNLSGEKLSKDDHTPGDTTE